MTTGSAAWLSIAQEKALGRCTPAKADNRCKGLERSDLSHKTILQTHTDLNTESSEQVEGYGTQESRATA